MKNNSSDSNLSRTMGLSAATAIGVGTMVGAGIFVFPGIAGGQAGPAALLSFLLSGLIALIVAACTAELSTAMPKSGGGYFFISRSFGAFLGTLIGIAQWTGLVFACAFYLAGFGEYCLELMEQFAIDPTVSPVAFALPATALLLVLNVVGTRNVGKFQNIIVIVLTLLLMWIYSYGFLDVVGLKGEERMFTTFFPEGKKAVLTTAALIFTSYLGFVQISTIAGEVKEPSKNLPRALIGSVLIVIVLYLFVLFVTTNILPVGKLKDLGEAATLEVAKMLIGEWGVLIVLFSGLLATLSSANASMMSSSRSLFALSKDGLIPQKAGTINEKFQTPHLSLILVAIPISLLLFRSNLELFAEVASFLHLIIYAGICLSLFHLRKLSPEWFDPSFKMPAGKAMAVIGTLCCLALVVFMKMTSILTGLAIIATSGVYYLIFKKGTHLPAPEMQKKGSRAYIDRILIPLDISDTDTAPIPQQLIKVLKASHVLILGYEKIPEQTDPEQADDENLEELNDRLDRIMDGVEMSQIDAEREAVHTNDLVESITRTIEKHQCHAILTAHPIHDLRRILIPLYHPQQLAGRLKDILGQLKESKETIDVQVVIIPRDEKEGLSAEAWTEKVNKQIGSAEVDTSYLKEKKGKSPSKIIKEITEDTDLVLLAESDVSNRESFFNRIHRNLEKAVSGPVMIILKEKNEK